MNKKLRRKFTSAKTLEEGKISIVFSGVDVVPRGVLLDLSCRTRSVTFSALWCEEKWYWRAVGVGGGGDVGYCRKPEDIPPHLSVVSHCELHSEVVRHRCCFRCLPVKQR